MRRRQIYWRVPIRKQYRELENDYGYTMLTAWNKFDKYERSVLCSLMDVELNKLPYTRISTVFFRLLNVDVNLKPMFLRNRIENKQYPLNNYRKRLVHAVNQQRRKRREKIKDEINAALKKRLDRKRNRNTQRKGQA